VSSPRARLTRAEVYAHFVNYFEAYLVLTRQAKQAAATGEVALLGRLMELRQQTIERIDRLQQDCAFLLSSKAVEEEEAEARKLRARVMELIETCQAEEEGMDAAFVKLRDGFRGQAEQLAKGQRGLRGYAGQANRQAQFFDTRK